MKTFLMPNIHNIYLVGVGGTGGYLAQGLAKLIAGYKLDLTVTLIDPDIVEEKNISRQNFMAWEVGTPKAEALAFRLNQQYGLDFGHFVGKGEDFLARKSFHGSLLITCVDKIAPRKNLKSHPLWLDLGNALDFGQVIFGTTLTKKECQRQIKVWNKVPHIQALPNAYLKGELKNRRDSRKRAASCADSPFAEQGCFVNELAAQAGLVLLHQMLVKGALETPAIYFDTAKGRMVPARITPEYLECA